jgi:hypothetical protein
MGFIFPSEVPDFFILRNLTPDGTRQGIREKWMEYWSITTGHRSIMTTNRR